ncbi:MAG: hypothetical protein LJE64_11275 [Desulfofustis sp.]|nr:hypothetical protein [Desulfofustis sp.]
MSVLKLKYTLPLLVITLLAVGGVKLFYREVEQFLLAESADVEPVPARAAASPASAPAANGAKPADISVITKRNLFASRTNAPPAAALPPSLQDAAPSSMEVVLMGTVTGTDGEARAVIYDKKERKQELYQEGDQLRQAAIKQILRGKVIITLNGRDELLDIAEARTVTVPQYGKPGVPRTTSRRVVGRPVVRGQEQTQVGPGPDRPDEAISVLVDRDLQEQPDDQRAAEQGTREEPAVSDEQPELEQEETQGQEGLQEQDGVQEQEGGQEQEGAQEQVNPEQGATQGTAASPQARQPVRLNSNAGRIIVKGRVSNQANSPSP